MTMDLKPKLSMVTCYDATFSRICCLSETVDYLLVGDSLGMVIKGESGTTHVSLDEVLYHTKAVVRGRDAVRNSNPEMKLPEIIVDLPVGTYATVEVALASAERVKTTGAEMIKVEGAVLDVVAALVKAGHKVCAHIGLTPQSIQDFKVQGRTEVEKARLRKEAHDLESAGATMIVLEMIPSSLAKEISLALKIPTIGIGAGPFCSGQVLVLYDLLGLNSSFKPKFLKTFIQGEGLAIEALKEFSREVKEGQYPDDAHSFV